MPCVRDSERTNKPVNGCGHQAAGQDFYLPQRCEGRCAVSQSVSSQCKLPRALFCGESRMVYHDYGESCQYGFTNGRYL